MTENKYRFCFIFLGTALLSGCSHNLTLHENLLIPGIYETSRDGIQFFEGGFLSSHNLIDKRPGFSKTVSDELVAYEGVKISPDRKKLAFIEVKERDNGYMEMNYRLMVYFAETGSPVMVAGGWNQGQIERFDWVNDSKLWFSYETHDPMRKTEIEVRNPNAKRSATDTVTSPVAASLSQDDKPAIISDALAGRFAEGRRLIQKIRDDTSYIITNVSIDWVDGPLPATAIPGEFQETEEIAVSKSELIVLIPCDVEGGVLRITKQNKAEGFYMNSGYLSLDYQGVDISLHNKVPFSKEALARISQLITWKVAPDP